MDAPLCLLTSLRNVAYGLVHQNVVYGPHEGGWENASMYRVIFVTNSILGYRNYKLLVVHLGEFCPGLFISEDAINFMASARNLCCMSFVGFSIYLFSLDSLGSLMFELFPNELLVCIYLWFGLLRSEAMRWHWFCWSVMIIYLLGSYSLLLVELLS